MAVNRKIASCITVLLMFFQSQSEPTEQLTEQPESGNNNEKNKEATEGTGKESTSHLDVNSTAEDEEKKVEECVGEEAPKEQAAPGSDTSEQESVERRETEDEAPKEQAAPGSDTSEQGNVERSETESKALDDQQQAHEEEVKESKEEEAPSQVSRRECNKNYNFLSSVLLNKLFI